MGHAEVDMLNNLFW